MQAIWSQWQACNQQGSASGSRPPAHTVVGGAQRGVGGSPPGQWLVGTAPEDILSAGSKPFASEWLPDQAVPTLLQSFRPDVDLHQHHAFVSFHMADLTTMPEVYAAPLVSKVPLQTLRTHKVRWSAFCRALPCCFGCLPGALLQLMGMNLLLSWGQRCDAES